jgi:hypothetical protein
LRALGMPLGVIGFREAIVGTVFGFRSSVFGEFLGDRHQPRRR